MCKNNGFNYLCTYDLYRPVCNVFYAGENITRGALEIETFLGPERARADRRVPFGAQKSQDFQGTTPS